MRVRVLSNGAHSFSEWSQWFDFTPAPLPPPSTPPASPTNLRVSPGNGKLSLTWTARRQYLDAVTGYDVHYTSLSAGYAPDTWPALDESEFYRYRPGNGWVAVSRTGDTASQAISGLTPGTAYRVRVRAKNRVGVSDWVVIKGTPSGTAPGVVVPALASADVLVSNIGQTTRSGASGLRTFVTGQTFTTGGPAPGYFLQSIEVLMNFNFSSLTSAQRSKIRAELWSADSNGKPSAKLYDLVLPTNFKTGINAFAAPPNAKLNANTAYSVVWYTIDSAFAGLSVRGTNSHGHDTSGSGWSIADDGFYKTANTPAGGGYLTGFRLKIRVNGTLVPNTVSLSASPNPVREGSPVTVTATLGGPLSEDVSIPIATASVANEITIPKGQTTGTYVHTAGDAPDGEIKREQMVVLNRLLKQMRPAIGLGDPYLVNVQVLDENADPPRVSVSDAKGWEQLNNYGRLCFEFTLDRAASHEVSVNYWTEDGTAKAGQDYTGKSPLSLGFAPGETRKSRCISIIDDGVEDSGETFYVVLGNPPEGAILGRDRGTGTIYNHEPTSLSGLTAEGASGEDGPFTALDIGTFAPATTAYTATVPHGTTHVRLVPASATNRYLQLMTGLEGARMTQVAFGGGTGPAVALAVGENVLVVKTQFNGQRQTYRVTVTRQEAPAAVAVSLSATPNPVAEGAAVTVTATLAEALDEAVTVPLTVTRGTSEDGDHGSLASITIPVGGTSATGTISTTDDADGDDETFTVALGSLPSGLAAGSASSVEVTITDSGVQEQQQQQQRTAPLTLSGLSGSTSTDGSDFGGTLDIGTFAPGTTEYAATVGNAVTHVKLTATAGEAGATLKVGKGSSLAAAADGSASAAIALNVGANALRVEVTAGDGTVRTYTVTVTRRAAPLTARLQAAVQEHDGETPFMVELVLSESLDSGSGWPSAASFDVKGGSVASVRRFRPYLYQVHIQPKSWRDVTVTLAGGRGCEEEGAICTADGRSVSNTSTLAFGGPVRIRIEGARAKEGKDANLDFAVTLNRAAAHDVSVDYATKDETATAGADYTATSGTLTFAAGETAKTIRVPVLDDAIDEGREVMRMMLSNPKGAYLRGVHTKARGIIVNDDALQRAWLSRFGRMAGSHVTDAVSGRLEGDLAPGTHATLAGQALDLSGGEDGDPLMDVLTGLAQRSGSPAPDDGDPFARLGAGDRWNDSGLAGTAGTAGTAGNTGKISMTGREVLLGSSFHTAGRMDGSGPGLAAWGRVAHGGFDGEQASDTGRLGIDGEVTTGTLGTDADWGRMLAGVAIGLSEGEGTFEDSGAETGSKGSLESTMTTVSPYGRYEVTDRVSAWGLVGWGTGDMTVSFDDGTAQVRTDLSLRMGALGARGVLLEQGGKYGKDGMDLALKADALYVRTDSDKAANSVATEAKTNRVRLLLEGGRTYELDEGRTLRPVLELGLRHDGGDAETGTGVEIGAGVSYANPLTGLSPTFGTPSGSADRLWGARDARGLAPGGKFDAGRGLRAEAGYGIPVYGGRYTGTPNVGYGASDGGATDWRVGWRLEPVRTEGPRIGLSLDAVRSEPADGDARHGVLLRGAIRW